MPESSPDPQWRCRWHAQGAGDIPWYTTLTEDQCRAGVPQWHLDAPSRVLHRVSAQAGRTWSRAVAKEHEEQPEPSGHFIVLALDEIWQYVKKKREKFWRWKALDRDTG